jgi:hypothetical protein
MKIIAKKFDFSKSEIKSITKKVLEQVKPNISYKGNIEIEIAGKNYIGSYQNSMNETSFTVESESEAKTVEKVTESVLKKHTKSELQQLCTDNSVEFETDNNKATLVALLLPVLNGE